MADPLLYGCDVRLLGTFLEELSQLSYGIDHPITIDVDQAMVTIKREEDGGEFHVMSVTAKE